MKFRFGLLLLCALGLVWRSGTVNGATVPLSDRATDLVRVRTNLGDFYIELYGNASDSPAHVINFLQYVRDGEFVNNIFHRTVLSPITNPISVVQGGAFRVDGTDLSLSADQIVNVVTRGPVFNEFKANNGLSNTRTTVAAARTNNPNSATSQWFVNLIDNLGLDAGPYTVFGAVIRGMDVVDAIGNLPHDTSNTFDGTPYEGVFGELPVTATGDFAVMYSVDEIPISIFEGDFDLDGDVDAVDYTIWLGGFGKTEGALPEEGDADFDGDVDGNDFLIWQVGFGQVAASSGGGSLAGSMVAVPEPTGFALLVAGLFAGLVTVRRVP